jgi:hypothetical protein
VQLERLLPRGCARARVTHECVMTNELFPHLSELPVLLLPGRREPPPAAVAAPPPLDGLDVAPAVGEIRCAAEPHVIIAQ